MESNRAPALGEESETHRELLEALAQLRRRNEALVEENRQLRETSESEMRHLASFPLLNPNPVLELDFSASATFCNPAGLALLADLGLALPSLAAILPPDIHTVIAALRRDAKGTRYREVTFLDRTFAEHFSLTAGLQGVRLYLYEITEKERVRRELAKALQLVNAHMDNSPLALVEFDPQFRVTRWSRQAERMFGWRQDEVLGRRIAELRWVHEEDAASVRRESESFLRGEKTGSVHFNRNLRKDGSVIYCEWYNSALSDEDGNLTSVLSFVMDVTARQEAELALRKSVGRLELLAKTAAELLHTTEPRRAVEAVCTRVLDYLGGDVFFSYLADEPQGQLRLNACAGVPATVAAGIERLEFGVAVCGCVARDGQRIVAESILEGTEERTALVRSLGVRAYACHPLLAPGGTILGTLSFGSRTRDRFDAEELSLMNAVADLVATALVRLRDTEALRESKGQVDRNLAELARINAELESFVYSVSHDLREPVHTVAAFTQLLLSGQAGRLDARGMDYLRRIERGAGRMSRLIGDLLDLSRVSRQSVKRTEINLSRIAEAAVAELREGSPGRRVEVDIAPGLTAVADPGLMEVVLSNLLANAWKFTSSTAAAHIRFGATVQEGRKVFFVADNGVGFDPSYGSELFQPFRRLHAGQEYPGTGIGLALVGRIVDRHGGRAWAEARPGAGATFFFTLGDER